MKDEDMAVRGHLCAGLQRFQREGHGCKPRFGQKGSVSGCDDTNHVYITHCPFCGELLPVVTQSPDEWADIYWEDLWEQNLDWQGVFPAAEGGALITETKFAARMGIAVRQ